MNRGTATELRRADHRERDVTGERITAAERDEVVHDPQTFPVSADSSAQALTRRTRTRTRTRRRPAATPAVPQPVYERPDDRSEVHRLASVSEGLVERVAFLDAAVRNLSQELYEIRQSGVLTQKDTL